jgi:hypothetical protein
MQISTVGCLEYLLHEVVGFPALYDNSVCPAPAPGIRFFADDLVSGNGFRYRSKCAKVSHFEKRYPGVCSVKHCLLPPHNLIHLGICKRLYASISNRAPRKRRSGQPCHPGWIVKERCHPTGFVAVFGQVFGGKGKIRTPCPITRGGIV